MTVRAACWRLGSIGALSASRPDSTPQPRWRQTTSQRPGNLAAGGRAAAHRYRPRVAGASTSVQAESPLLGLAELLGYTGDDPGVRLGDTSGCSQLGGATLLLYWPRDILAS